MTESQALDRLHDILARPEFRVERARVWWEQLLGPVWDLATYLVARFLQTVAETASGGAGWYGGLVLAVCGLLLGGALVYLTRAIRLSITRDSRSRSIALAERRERSERLWQTGQHLASAGRFADAARSVYLSALYALDERALLHVESSQTNREHARRLRQLHPELAQTFGEVVERYDRVRYGQVVVTDATFGELSALVARARSSALGGATA